MYKVILTLDKFFLEYEGGFKLTPPPWKTTLKKPSLIRVKEIVTVASLSLMQNPAIKLAPNRNKALQIYNHQIWKLDLNLKDKRVVTEFEANLQKVGFVEFVKDVTPE